MAEDCGACRLVLECGKRYCCCPKPAPFLPRWAKTVLLMAALAVPVILAARWVVARGHLEHVTKRLDFLAGEKEVLGCEMESMVKDKRPSQDTLRDHAARKKAAFEQLRDWTWMSIDTKKLAAKLRKHKEALQWQYSKVCAERDCARRDFEILQSVMSRNQYGSESCLNISVCSQ